jgi:uncharacterized SAM-binding protein YcdF (DUF218 family)
MRPMTHNVVDHGRQAFLRSMPLLRRWTFRALSAIGIMTLAAILWLLAPTPLLLDWWLDVSDRPQPADAIICLGAGTTVGQLPTEEGWSRLYTTTQLAFDRYAPIVVFSGRGSEPVSEAELYASAGEWLGIPRDVVILDAGPASTAEHPLTLLSVTKGYLHRKSRLILVTSPLHSRRALMTFRKQGFENVRVVSTWRSARTDGRLPGLAVKSSVPGFVRDTKAYDDPLFRLRVRSSELLVAARETVALVGYWWRGSV